MKRGMTVVHLVIEDSGAYDTRWREPVAAFTDAQEAERWAADRNVEAEGLETGGVVAGYDNAREYEVVTLVVDEWSA